MKRIIKNNYKFILGVIVGLIISVTSVYAIEAYIESNKVTYTNHNKANVEEAIDELYERSGIHKEKWVDKELNGADPVLKNPLIPVEIKPNGEVYYANLNSEWYNYSEKRWANAVILNDNVSYKVGDHILDKDIKGYFVWIPRYQYKIWTLANTDEYKYAIAGETVTNENKNLYKLNGNERLIDIKFGNVENAPKMSESEAAVDSYYTHPAFTLGDKNLNGIWAGKFETGGSENNVIVKPNVSSWRNQTVKEFFDAGKSFAKGLDSHMMKNTEWGAVAYLSHSQYGIGHELNINNTQDLVTGYGAAANTDQTTYTGEIGFSSDITKTGSWSSGYGYLASTTGNITGIYDMSGGAWEWMAACVEGEVSSSEFDEATLAQEMEKGYIDKYAKNDMTFYNNRILGDATGEMGPFYNYYEDNGISYNHSSWYGDGVSFTSNKYPWVYRGGYAQDGILTGIFDSAAYTGEALLPNGFRIALSCN